MKHKATRPRHALPPTIAHDADVAPVPTTAISHITERTRAERELAESAGRCRTLFDAIDEGFCVVEVIFEHEKPIDYRFLEINPAFEKHTGLIDARGRRMRELAPQHEEYWFEIYGRIAVSGQPARFVHRAEQLHRWYDVYAFRVDQPEDRHVAILFSDITERRRTEELLRQERDRYMDLVNCQPAGIYRLRVSPRDQWRKDAWIGSKDAPTSVELANDRFFEILGTSRQAFLTNPGIVNDLVHPEDKADFARKNEEANATLLPFQWEGRLLTQGKLIWVRFRSLPRPEANGDVVWTGILDDITERIRTEAALKDSEYFFRESQRAAFIGSYKTDFTTGFWESSEVLDQIFGIGRDYSRNVQGWLEIVHPDDREMMDRYLREEVTGKRQPFWKEYRIIRNTDSEVRWVCGAGEVSFDADGNILSMIGTIQDITERKQIEETLRKSEALLKEAQRVGQLGSWDWDAVTGRITWSEEYCRIYGVDPERRPPGYEEHLKLYTSESAARLDAAVKHSMQTGEAYRLDLGLAHGSREWVTARGEARHDPNGRIVALCGTAQDITERKRAEDEIGKLHRAVEASGEVIFLTDRDGMFTYVNPMFAKVYGFAAAEVVGQMTPRILKSDVMSPQDYEAFWKTLLGGQVVQEELVNKTKDGRIIDIESSANPVLDDNGDIVGFLAVQRDVTERRRAEERLQKRERQLSESQQIARLGSWDLDLITATLEWSDQTFELFDRSPATYIPSFDEFARLVHPEDRETMQTNFDRALATDGTPYHLAVRIINDSGRQWVMEAVGAVRRDNSGRPLSMFGTAQDVTERRLAEVQLRTMAEMLNTAPNSITVFDRQGRYLFANRKAHEIHGYDEREFMALTVRDVDAPESMALFEERMQVMAEKGEATYEVAHVRKDGTEVPLEVFVKRVEWGGAPAILSVATDISERKRAEKAVQESERTLKGAQRVAHLGSWDHDLETDVIVWSEELCRIYGVDPKLPVPGFEDLAQFYTPESWAQLRSAVANARQTGAPFELDVQIVPADRTVIWATTRGEVRRDATGRIVGTRGTLLDITDRKRAEEEKAVLEGQLQQAQKMESVGRLAGGVAHDFNNMLGVILGHAELAIEQVDPAVPLHADLEEIREAAMRSADLTRQLLAFARKQTVAPEVLDLNETVTGMLAMLRRLIGENISVKWQPGADLWPVKVDPSQIDQILANLCVNARDAISGVGNITIETGNSTLDENYGAAHAGCVPGEYVQFTVSDDGCGMDKETLSQAFEPFFTTKAVGKGTGMGLAMVYGSVSQNHGFVNIYSEPNLGTTFTVYLPRHVGKTVQPLTGGPARSVLRGHETILLVEDEAAILRLSKRMLEHQGYTVLAASTPGEGIRLATEHSGEIDLLMTDVVMPEMNGRALAKNLLSLYPHLKRLFMSGYTADVIADHGVLDEGVHFIQKPFSTEDLASKVRKALDAQN